ncbi:MAG: TraB/GumN family protein, partial [Calditrichaeota bacterium]|nr:TraB/GumN family protein [Calditrichota bacterium]
VSAKSVDEVERVIEQVKPDTICVELCQTRYDAIKDKNRWSKLDIFQVVREKKVLFLLSNIAISSFQRRIGNKLGVKPGAEFQAAIDKAEETKAHLVLADRDIQATLKRTWANLSFFKKINTLALISSGLFEKNDISEAEIEAMKDKDKLSELLNEFAKAVPEIKQPLIDERDQFLMSAIEAAEGKKIVAVVGAGHVEGMKANFGKEIDRESLSVIPPKSSAAKLAQWIIPALVLAAFYIGFQKNQWDTFEEMLYAWILPNSIFAAVLTAFGGAKLLSIITAFIASPITSLNPALPVGVIVGYVEAKLRKPTVADCERIPEDAQDIKGLYRNQFTRVLVVAFLSIIGSALGAWIGISWLIKIITS